MSTFSVNHHKSIQPGQNLKPTENKLSINLTELENKGGYDIRYAASSSLNSAIMVDLKGVPLNKFMKELQSNKYISQNYTFNKPQSQNLNGRYIVTFSRITGETSPERNDTTYLLVESVGTRSFINEFTQTYDFEK